MRPRTRKALAVLAVAIVAKFALGCQHVHQDLDTGSTRIYTLGAGTVTVLDDGSVETSSPGFSEGFSGVLTYTMQTAANFLRLFVPFPTPAAPAPASSCNQ